MAALTANRKVPNIPLSSQTAGGAGIVVDLLMGAAETFYKGGFAALDGGDLYGAPLAAGEIFEGIFIDSGTSGASNGSDSARVIAGAFFQHALASIAQADIGKCVSASDDQTLTLVKTSNSAVGRIFNVPATGTCIVKMREIGQAMTVAATASAT